MARTEEQRKIETKKGRHRKVWSAIRKMKAVSAGKEVGIEIEMEGINLPSSGDTKTFSNWYKEKDYSLRGPSGEFVLKAPVHRTEVVNNLFRLVELFKKEGSKLHPSDRCGVHVHINVQEMSLQELLNFIILYLCLEDVLIKYCGESREGNLFCLRNRDAEYFLIPLRKFAKNLNSEFSPFSSDMLSGQFKYGAINYSSIYKYGSLEFRSLQTPKNILDIKIWVDLILAVKDASLKFDTAADICGSFSSKGAVPILEMIFGKQLVKELKVDSETPLLIFESIRRIQTIAFTTPYSKKELSDMAEFNLKTINDEEIDPDINFEEEEEEIDDDF